MSQNKNNQAVAGDTGGDDNQTDAIIEELRALAKSMLDATNAARRRSSQLEGKRSLETFIHATNTQAANPGRRSGDFHVDPLSGVEDTKEGLTDIPVSLSPQFQKPTATSERGVNENSNTLLTDGSPNVNDSTNNNSSFGSPEDYVRASATGERGPTQRASEARDTEDDDSGIFDGVKTTILFSSTDPDAYQDAVSSVWKPESLLLGPDGKAVQPKGDEEEEEEDDDDEETIVKGKPLRVFRIPLFPYGGGVSQEELKDLSLQFAKSIKDSSRSGRSVRPKYISKNDFSAKHFDDIAIEASQRVDSFHPVSPYEFVVEVDRGIIFDAVRTRERRRQEFQRLVKENRAPATMGTFNLRVIMDPLKTGFEDEKNFPIIRGSIIADRYQIIQLLGKATFSRAVRCYDLLQPIYDEETEAAEGGDEDEASKEEREPIGYVEVCLKIINNTKDFFDQSLDEIRLLTLINKYRDPDEAHVVRLIDAFYFKEHTMLVTELLSDNLYEFSKYNREEEEEFTHATR
ncbi:protein kinase [Angomonas deanei]|nr:protein kinase [Angomonas deanei]|eukprot:EPY26417.1 protein kinase [Angomonas deanei]